MSEENRDRSGDEGDRAPARRARLLLLLSWLVPGAGHILLGRRGRGLAFLAIVAACVLIGLDLDGNLYRVIAGRPLTIIATLASMGMGAPYFALRFLVGYEGDIVAPGYEYGTAFLLTAGLMNLLLVLDVWDIQLGQKR